MSFTLYLWIQIPLTIALVCFVIYQHRVYSKQKKLVKKMIERQKQNIEKTELETLNIQVVPEGTLHSWQEISPNPNIEKKELEISEDLLKWREERRQFNRQWDKFETITRSKWPWW